MPIRNLLKNLGSIMEMENLDSTPTDSGAHNMLSNFFAFAVGCLCTVLVYKCGFIVTFFIMVIALVIAYVSMLLSFLIHHVWQKYLNKETP